MRCKKISALFLTFIMVVGLVPAIPQRMNIASAATIRNVVRSISGITEPDGGWGSNFTASNFKFAKDASIDGKADIQATKSSVYQNQPDKWTPTVSLSTNSVDVSVNAPINEAEGGKSFTVSLSGYSNIPYNQTSAMIYNSSTNEVLAYGKIGDATVSNKTFTVPAGMPVGDYVLWVFFERFDVNGADQITDIGTVIFSLKSSGEVEEKYDVTVDWEDGIKRASGATSQPDVVGAMVPVVVTVSDTHKYYFPTNYSSIGIYNGISVVRNTESKVTVSGTPTADTDIILAAPAMKDTQAEPDVTGGVLMIKDTDESMEYSDSKNGTYEQCSAGSTSVAAGTWYVRYMETADKQPGEVKEVNVSAAPSKYYVILNNSADGNMTRLTSSGAENQQNIAGEMKTVVYNANSGYYFPDTYPINTKNGISISRVSPTQIQVSGTPTANTSIDLEPASIKPTPDAPNVTAGALKLIGTTQEMQYADSTNPSRWYPCQEGETLVTAGTKYVRYKETDTNKAGIIKEVEVTDNEEPAPPIDDPDEEGYSVTIVNPYGSHITIATETENLYYQSGLKGAMKRVYYYADAEYYFPSSYKGTIVNGVKVARSGSRMLTISGTPTEDTVINLTPAISINTPLYPVTVLNGSGDEYYVEGVAVEIIADDNDGQTFSNWKVSQGDVTLVNSKSKTTTFTMPAAQVVIEACYSSGTSSDNNSGSQSGDTGNNTSSNTNTDNTNSGNNSGDSGSSFQGNNGGTTINPVSKETLDKNSKVLSISSKAIWNNSNKAWKVTWNAVSGADGYDVLAAVGKNTLKKDSSSPTLSGNNSTTAYLKTIGGSAVDKSKTYKIQVKAYRVVNRSKEYIGTGRILYVAGPNNKTYTNIKLVRPVKKTLKINKGKTKKIQTAIKKQKSSKTLMSNPSGKKFNYISSDTSIATVNKSGKVKGIKAGNCKIYVLAQNGVRTTVNIQVK